jgi:hypothetical protein
MSESLKPQPGDRLWMGGNNQGTVIDVSPQGLMTWTYGSKGMGGPSNLKDQ